MDISKDKVYAEELESLHREIDLLTSKLDKQNQTLNEVCQVINNLTQLLTSIDQNSRINSQNINVLKNRLENLPYEMNDPICAGKYALPHIMSLEETIQAIANDHKSIARFGDGEFGLIFGDARWRFQQTDDKLALRLRQVVTSDEPNILIGLINFYGDLSHRTPHDADGIRSYITPAIRAQHMQLLNLKRLYANTGISRSTSWDIVKLQKTIWNQKDCVFIEGNLTRMGVGNDLFDNARSIQRILCPAENAFDRYDDILNEARKLSTDKTILIALGPTASVLAYDLALIGYHAIDIGHVDLSYEWLIRNNGVKTAVTTKYNNEYPEGYIVEDIHDPVYDSQIIADVSCSSPTVCNTLSPMPGSL